MWSLFCGSDVATFENDLLAWLGTISAGDSVDKEKLGVAIDTIIREKRRITPMLNVKQFAALKKNLNQKKQNCLTKCGVVRKDATINSQYFHCSKYFHQIMLQGPFPLHQAKL